MGECTSDKRWPNLLKTKLEVGRIPLGDHGALRDRVCERHCALISGVGNTASGNTFGTYRRIKRLRAWDRVHDSLPAANAACPDAMYTDRNLPTNGFSADLFVGCVRAAVFALWANKERYFRIRLAPPGHPTVQPPWRRCGRALSVGGRRIDLDCRINSALRTEDY